MPGMERGLLRLPWICLKIRRKHHPSPWDLLSKIAIAHSSLGRLRDLLPGRPHDLLLGRLRGLLRKKSDNEGGGGFKQLDGGVSLAPHPAAGFRSDPTRPWNSFSSTMSSMKRQRRFSARRRLKCRSNCYEPFAWIVHTTLRGLCSRSFGSSDSHATHDPRDGRRETRGEETGWTPSGRLLGTEDAA